jgi:ABC-type polysaccharide/polyol phosphate transport system ATPase subunit
MTGREYALEAEGLGKAYQIYHGPARRVAEVLSFGRYTGHHEVWALRDVSLRLKPGAALGLCGANGAGKSTLLKILAGTTAPSKGRYRFGGRVASLLELGAGFHLDFTGRANILMNGVMMGFSKREIASKTDEIIEFAELGSYIDEPVRMYSSGMGMRLGFAVAMAMDPDVLIIDEVFAVGDMYFQKKCVDKIYEFRQRNRTILFCSHSLYDIRQLCDEALWLDHGRDMAQGDSIHVTTEYGVFQREHIGEGADHMEGQFEDAPELSDPLRRQDLPRILDARIYSMDSGEPAGEVQTGDSIEVRIWWKNPRPDRTPVQIGIALNCADTTTLAACSTQFDDYPVEGTEGCTILEFPEVDLLSNQLLVPIWLLDEKGVHKYDEFMIADPLTVRVPTRDIGHFRIRHRWRSEALPLPPRSDSPEGAVESAR